MHTVGGNAYVALEFHLPSTFTFASLGMVSGTSESFELQMVVVPVGSNEQEVAAIGLH